MNTEVPTSPSAPVSDAPTSKILAGAPLAPNLNPSAPLAIAPAVSPTAPAVKTTTAKVNAATGVIYQGKVYEKGATITAPRKALRKFAKAVTIAAPARNASRSDAGGVPASKKAAPAPTAAQSQPNPNSSVS
jgi:hypothetical protein